jgi:hypothetical protein
MSWIHSIVRATTGIRLQSKVRFGDLSIFGAFFNASVEHARRFVPEPFVISELGGGCTELSILGLDYRDIDLLEPYREIAISLPVRYRDPKGEVVEGSFCLQMPGTSQEARDAGVANYGFPKTLADLQFDRIDDKPRIRLDADGRHALTLVVDELPTSHGMEHFINLNLRDDDRIVLSSFDVEGDIGITASAGGARLELGDHPIADQLRQLHVSSLSHHHLYVPKASAVLSAGAVRGTVARPVSARPGMGEHAHAR